MNRHGPIKRRTREAIAAELLSILDAADHASALEAETRGAPDAAYPHWRDYVDTRIRRLAEGLTQ
ncbi:hypothetical protein [Skermania piniformis]|uniref:Uncharacterized protein n=1 Tax=Skermania pinensis TaxID=39122 RepID=A0ABX8SAG8_9ACTN|nr:hypothetical protein [Skermania piniformis]QXQ14858.1 hypothetical protein KV203_05605 [Skermania piniformis]